MGVLFQWIKLNQTRALVGTVMVGAETETETGTGVVTGMGVVTVIVIMEVVVVGEDLVETASNAASLDTLLENVHLGTDLRGEVDMVGGMIDMEEEEAVAMGLIVVGTAAPVDATGMAVVVEDLIAVIVQVHMSALDYVTSVCGGEAT